MEDITHVKITNTDMIREMNSQAVLATNRTDLEQYKRARDSKLKSKLAQENLEKRVSDLERRLELLEKGIFASR